MRIAIYFPLSLLLGLLPCAQASSIKVMSFNIRYDGAAGSTSNQQNAWLAESGLHRRDLALRAIADYDPDLLGLQEALKNQVDDVVREFGDLDYYGVGRDDGKQTGEFCCIFFRRARFSKVAEGTFWLNENAEQPGTRFPETCCARIASWIVLQERDAKNRELLVVNTHWDHQVQLAREFSARLIKDRLPSLANGRPIIVMGDLNAGPDNPAIQTLLASGRGAGVELLDSGRQAKTTLRKDEGTFHGFRGRSMGARIDYVLHTAGFQTLQSGILRTSSESRYPSDHYPVTATLEFSK